MKILILHNAYQQRGGEDTVVRAEFDLLKSAGYDVQLVTVTNDALHGGLERVRAFLNAPYDHSREQWMGELVRASGANVVHVHNFFPLLTPAIHVGASMAGAAVVQTLHNYRLLCANAMLLRNGRVCEKCIKSSKYWSVAHRCYRNSAIGSAAVARMQSRVRREGVWMRHVHRFIALTDFSASKFVSGGLPKDRIVVKPNFTAAPRGQGVGERMGGLYVGRLSAEKGVSTLIDAWRSIPDIDLSIVGDGPEADQLRRAAPPNVKFLGARPSSEIQQHMQSAAFLVVPSQWYEGFPMTIVEAFSVGLPVMASRIGSLKEIVRDRSNGILFEPSSAADIVASIRSIGRAELVGLGKQAYKDYCLNYTPEVNLDLIESIYEQACMERGGAFGMVRR